MKERNSDVICVELLLMYFTNSIENKYENRYALSTDRNPHKSSLFWDRLCGTSTHTHTHTRQHVGLIDINNVVFFVLFL